MEERQVTIDGVRYPLSENFTVLATQNPIEFEGTYPLPEAQLDRFLLKIRIVYPSGEEEIEILSRYDKGSIHGVWRILLLTLSRKALWLPPGARSKR